MCLVCGFTNVGEEEIPSPFDENDLNRLTNDVWIGAVTVNNLPISVYLKTATHLKKGVDIGFAEGLIKVEYTEADLLMLQDLSENIYIFSGAKTYQQVRSMSDLLAQPELKSSFFKFKQEASKIFTDYNDAYLQAEYQTAVGSSRMAANWGRIMQDADVLPLLKYQTVGDARVRPTHRDLDNIVRPVNDKFWTNYYPPNGWRCRCTVIQLSEGEEDVTDLQGWLKPNDVPPEFMMNSGIDRYVFKTKGKDKHPYFDIAKGDKEAAKTNWGFPAL